MREFDKIKDCDGSIIQSGDTVYFKCKISNQITEGVIHHMIGGSFGIEGPRYRSLYKYQEVRIYSIKKKHLLKTNE